MADYYGNADFSCYSIVVHVCIAIKLVLKKCYLGLLPLVFVKHYFNKLIIFYTIKSNLHTPALLPN